MQKNLAQTFDASNSKEFHIGDLISTYHGILVTPEGTKSVYKTADFLLGEDFRVENLEPAADLCKRIIEKQFPAISEIETDTLTELIRHSENQEAITHVVASWLNLQAHQYGEKIHLIALTEKEKDTLKQELIDEKNNIDQVFIPRAGD